MAEEILQTVNGATPSTISEIVEVDTSSIVPTPQGAHLDAERGVFVTSKGTDVPLTGAKISALILERITNEGKPKIPRIEVTLLGKHKEMQANPNDPGYLALLKEWEESQNIRVMRYVLVVGVKGEPPQDFININRQFLEDASDLDMKYLWASSLVPDEDLNALVTVILGRSLTTTKGLEEAANFSE